MPICEGCSAKLNYGEPYHSGYDGVDLCPDCAPTFGQIRRSPETLVHHDTGDPLTQDEADDIVAAHIAKGGKLTDPYVSK